MTTQPRRLLLLLLLLAALSAAVSPPPAVAKLFVRIPPADEACFEEAAVDGSPGLRGRFEVVEGGNLDVDATVRRLGGDTLGWAFDRSRSVPLRVFERAQEGDLDALEGPGRYLVCFANRFSTVTGKVVAFSLHGGVGELIEDEEVAKRDMVRPLERLVEQLADKVQQLHDDERYLNDRMKRHMATAHSTATRVSFMTAFEALVLVGVSVAQLLYLRSYFDRRLVL